jgi:hypothetical protein
MGQYGNVLKRNNLFAVASNFFKISLILNNVLSFTHSQKYFPYITKIYNIIIMDK